MDTKSITGYADYPKLFEMYKQASVTAKEGDSCFAPYPFYFNPTLHRYRLDEPQRKIKPQTIFVCSMADLFGSWIPDEWIEAVFEACEKAPQHRYLFLTKNPERYRKLYLSGKLPLKDNIWYGTTVTNDIEAERLRNAIDILDSDYHTFTSIEPLRMDITNTSAWEGALSDYAFSNWIIIGAETGNNKNKIVPDKMWVDKILITCFDENIYPHIPIFMKDSLIPIVGEENIRREFPWD